MISQRELWQASGSNKQKGHRQSRSMHSHADQVLTGPAVRTPFCLRQGPGWHELNKLPQMIEVLSRQGVVGVFALLAQISSESGTNGI